MGAALNALGQSGMISRLELLLPGDRLLAGDGTLHDLAGQLSRRGGDPLHPDALILRHCVPVRRQGRTVAVLCGVIDLDRLPELFTVTEFEDTLYLYVVEGTTGNFLMDTWHDSLGNLSQLGPRKTRPGYSWDQFTADLAQGRACTLAFRSKSVGATLYAYAAPVGVEDWMVALNVPEHQVFAQAEGVMSVFIALAVLLLAAFALYFLWVLRDIRREREASATQLRNIRYMLDVEKELFDAHMQPGHFTTALQRVAEYLSAGAAFFWLADGAADVQRRLWSSREDQALERSPQLLALFPDLFPIIQERGFLLCYDMEDLCRQFPVGGKSAARYQIRSLMLISVTGLSGELALILGACNLERRWENTEPLEQVAVSFSMALNHYAVRQTLVRMGQVDSLTGLMNRNSHHAALAALAGTGHRSLGCVYLDANGLHELNNHLGHQAGDEMLQAVAGALRRSFPQGDIFRIGGDEFVILCPDQARESVCRGVETVRRLLGAQSYEVSTGIAWQEGDWDAQAVVNSAEAAMQRDKRQFYQSGGNDRRIRSLDQKLEQMISEKQDADTFLSVLAPVFKGVYFVNLERDTVRHLFIPPYFESLLQEAEGRFSRALLLYARRIAQPAYSPLFEAVCDYGALEARLDENPEFTYQKRDGTWMNLRILKFKSYQRAYRETLWIFEHTDDPQATAENARRI